MRLVLFLASCSCLPAVAAARADAPAPTFEQRVAWQRTIDRFSYEHQLGATVPFDAAVPPAATAARVRRSLAEEGALADLWRTRIDAAALARELGRIHARTRLPERLSDLESRLGGDPRVVAEALARPRLAARLLRSFFAADRALHAAPRAEAEALLDAVRRGALDPAAEHARRRVVEARRDGGDGGLPPLLRSPGRLIESEDGFAFAVVLAETPDTLRAAAYRVPKVDFEAWWAPLEERYAGAAASGAAPGAPAAAAPPCLPDDTWERGLLEGMPDARYGHTAVWTGSLLLVWGGFGGSYLGSGAAYDPLLDAWSRLSNAGAPSPRWSHTAVWTGQRMVVWGGSDDAGVFGDGARYDPATDTWSPMSLTRAPSARDGHTAAWTGTTMIVWGGAAGAALAGGGRYDPVADSWSRMSTAGQPSARYGHTAVWTGSRMLVWGGSDGTTPLATGAGYDPAADAWAALPAAGAPAAREGHTAVWTGTRMVVWGGRGAASAPLNSGGRYDPAATSWSGLSTAGAPAPRGEHTAVWTGTRMLAWGGAGAAGPLGDGGRYDPAADAWTPLAAAGAPAPRQLHAAAWTGSLMLVWGGRTSDSSAGLDSGGRYDPAADAWTPIRSTPRPGRRFQHTAVWTGSAMIVWGGTDGVFTLASGGRYDPLTDDWTPVSTVLAPAPRARHTAVWTGDRMVVWGGADVGALDSGGRYDPALDKWQATSLAGAPGPREQHTAVWTGDRMIVWGGRNVTALAGGGRYDPLTNAWAPVAAANAPSARYLHTATWTGSRMFVWGGVAAAALGDGALYDPAADAWTAAAAAGAPGPRYNHRAAWTGARVFVWGGFDGAQPLADGGRFDAGANAWAPVATAGAPSARQRHTLVAAPAGGGGTVAIVWGGQDADAPLATGGRYDAQADAWQPTATSGAPEPRAQHTAVWADDAMIVWGGQGASAALASGGRYALGQVRDRDGDGVTCRDDCDDANAAVYPGAPQVCDGVNNDCAAAGWPSLAGTAEADDDGDGATECGGDCDDADPGVVRVPGEVGRVTLSGGTVSWLPPADPGGATPPVYDTLRAPHPDLAGAACAESGGADTTTVDAAVPAPGTAFHYLVRARNACGTGTLGRRSSGDERTAAPCP